MKLISFLRMYVFEIKTFDPIFFNHSQFLRERIRIVKKFSYWSEIPSDGDGFLVLSSDLAAQGGGPVAEDHRWVGGYTHLSPHAAIAETKTNTRGTRCTLNVEYSCIYTLLINLIIWKLFDKSYDKNLKEFHFTTETLKSFIERLVNTT